MLLIYGDLIAHAPFFKPCSMSHEMAHRDRLWIGIRNLHRSQISVDVGIKVYFTLLDQLHHRSPGKQLRCRSDSEHASCGVDWGSFFDVRMSIALSEQELAIPHDRNDRPWNLVLLHIRFHYIVNKTSNCGGVVQIRSHCIWFSSLRGCIGNCRRDGFLQHEQAGPHTNYQKRQ
ncbi:hypothetical protein D3C73_517280 [compost metagenome]